MTYQCSLSVCRFQGVISYRMLSLVDGHGGREVARFCSNWLPKEAALLGNKRDLPGTMVRMYNRYELNDTSFTVL